MSERRWETSLGREVRERAARKRAGERGQPVVYGGWETASGREIRENAERNAKAHMAMLARRVERAAEAGRRVELQRIEAEAQADRELRDHVHELAEEMERARYRAGPNPWLQPWTPGTNRVPSMSFYRRPDAVRPRTGRLFCREM